MELKFIGNGSAFSKTNNSAFFEINNNLYMIDSSMININRMKMLFDFTKYDSVNIIVTHTHADHVNAIPNIIDYLKYFYHIKLNIIIPSSLKEDIISLNRICGVSDEDYNIIDSKNVSFIKETIKTEHASKLLNGSYGYIFEINNKLILYTGDSANLDVFDKWLSKVDEAYIDTSYNKTIHHSNIEEVIKLKDICKHIYIMHLDNEEELKNIVRDIDNISICELYK